MKVSAEQNIQALEVEALRLQQRLEGQSGAKEKEKEALHWPSGGRRRQYRTAKLRRVLVGARKIHTTCLMNKPKRRRGAETKPEVKERRAHGRECREGTPREELTQ